MFTRSRLALARWSRDGWCGQEEPHYKVFIGVEKKCFQQKAGKAILGDSARSRAHNQEPKERPLCTMLVAHLPSVHLNLHYGDLQQKGVTFVRMKD